MAFIDANNEKDIQKINSIREEVSFKRNQFELSLKNYLDNVDNFKGFVYGLETILNRNISI